MRVGDVYQRWWDETREPVDEMLLVLEVLETRSSCVSVIVLDQDGRVGKAWLEDKM